MAEFNQFGSVQPSGQPGKAQCAQCEAMLTDALDHLLSPEDQRIFDLHLATCAECTRMYMEARRGADWMLMLKDAQPEPPADLMARILQATSRATAEQTTSSAAEKVTSISEGRVPNTLLAAPVTAGAPMYAGQVLPFRQRVVNAFRVQTLRHNFMQPRLAMTAAMAFFSIALTLNLTGVHVTSLRPSDLTPSSLKRSFYDTNAKVARSFDNLRVVYELESRLQDLQRSSEPAAGEGTTSQPASEPKKDEPGTEEQRKQQAPRPRSGSSRTNLPARSWQYSAVSVQPYDPARHGSPQPAARLTQVAFGTPNVFRHQHHESVSGGQA